MKPYYSDNYATIYNCDCRELIDILPKSDLIITDPPYGLSYQSNWPSKTGNMKDKIKNDSIDEYMDMLCWLREFLEKVMADDWVFG